VSQSHRAFIADFGVSTTLHSAATVTFKTTTHRAGTLRWQAPELSPNMNNADTADTEWHNTQASDVYAFALVCYEVSLSFHSHFCFRFASTN
jgi:serine/threonine protein kinase